MNTVFFTPRMVAESGSYSPSAAKPQAVVEDWAAHGLDFSIVEPAPASFEELCRAHDPTFVRGVLDRRIANGFGNRSEAVARALPYTSGAMLSAARHVLAVGGIAAAPCSGFHHAGHREASGFCTFNGLMVTAAALRAEGRVERVGILDLDMHYGDGTDDIIGAIGAQSWIDHHTAGATARRPDEAGAFLRRLPAIVRGMKGCDVILYQAGADPHVDDPLGGWMTTDELRARDAIVFAASREIGAPLVWNLAGGYQRDAMGGIGPVLEIHRNTARAWLSASPTPP